MGAGQSSGRGEVEVDVKTSYYELLGVERQATDDEIKKAYRKKALELHPDRNYGNEENATKIFADVQAAYEVLSDPQERAWYDSHESAILRGADGQGDDTPSYQNVPITSADDLARLVRKFNSNVDFSDAPSGFYGFLRSTFEQLAKEESIAAAWEDLPEPEYPTFGHKDDTYDPVVKSFYAAWSSFSTVKTFAWKDKYKLSEAPDRWYRRRMEKENKAFRQEGIKEFNDAVRTLIAFVRKRDPRHTPTTQSEADRQKVLREAAAAQAARARAANQIQTENAIPEWAQSRAPDPEEGDFEDEEDEDQEVFECVACNKIFKSEKQWEAHEKSKKHQKAVYALRKKMRKQNAHLDLDDESQFTSSGVVTPDAEEDEEVEEEEDHSTSVAAETEEHAIEVNGSQIDESDGEISNPEHHNNDEDAGPPHPHSQLSGDEISDSEDSDYASAEAVRARLASTSISTPATTASETGEADAQPEKESQSIPHEEDDDEESAKPKIGKAAQKRAKKAAAAAEADAPANSHACATCNATFSSRSQLFQHIAKNDHAALKSVSAGAPTGGKGKKGKGKK